MTFSIILRLLIERFYDCGYRDDFARSSQTAVKGNKLKNETHDYYVSVGNRSVK